MKKILSLLLLVGSSFAVDLDINQLECHCEKHSIIMHVHDNDKVSEMSKHCMINEDKKNSTIKFFDDNSKSTVKCSVVGEKIELASCKEVKLDKHKLKRMSSAND